MKNVYTYKKLSSALRQWDSITFRQKQRLKKCQMEMSDLSRKMEEEKDRIQRYIKFYEGITSDKCRNDFIRTYGTSGGRSKNCR